MKPPVTTGGFVFQGSADTLTLWPLQAKMAAPGHSPTVRVSLPGLRPGILQALIVVDDGCGDGHVTAFKGGSFRAA